MAAADLTHLFPQYWLESQILPQGYGIVANVDSPVPPSIPRPATSIPKAPFRALSALRQPTLYASPNAQGYARAYINITRGVAEVYQREEDHIATSPAGNETHLNVETPRTGTPPFYPLFRVFLNDKAVYQTRVIQPQAAGDVPATGVTTPVNSVNTVRGFNTGPTKPPSRAETSSSTQAGSPTANASQTAPVPDLALAAVHDLTWDEEVQLWLHSPASIVTLQLFEKDFYVESDISEDLLTSISIPLASLSPGKPIDLALNVFCTLPQSYSLESLTSEAERLALYGPNELDETTPNPILCPPSAIMCRIHVSVLIETTRGMGRHFSELAALSLPDGPWTPSVITTALTQTDQIQLLAHAELLAMDPHDKPLSALVLSKALVTLILAMWHVDIHSDEREVNKFIQAYSIRYTKMAEDALVLAEYIILGPLEHVRSPTSRRHGGLLVPLSSLAMVVGIWIIYVINSHLAPAATYLLLAFCIHVLRQVHIPRRPVRSHIEKISPMIAALKGAEMFTTPLQNLLMKPLAVRRLRVLELWLSVLRERVVAHPESEQEYSIMRSWLKFTRKPITLVPTLLLCVCHQARALFWPLVGLLLTGAVLRHTQGITATRGLIRGAYRYNKLLRVRRTAQAVQDGSNKQRTSMKRQ